MSSPSGPGGPQTPNSIPPWLRWLRQFVGWFLQHLYTDLAWAYDLVASLTSVGQWWRWQTAVDECLPDGRLLEVGHGTGRLLRRQLRAGRSVVGMDLSRQMIRIASRRLEQAGLPRILVRARAQALPFAAGTFNGAYATFPSKFILEPDTCAEVLRALTPEGVFVIVASAWIRGRGFLDRLARFLYLITGQSPNDDLDWLTPMTPAGGTLTWEIVEQARARVLRIRIRREEDS